MIGQGGLKAELEGEGFTVLGLDDAKKDFAFGTFKRADFIDPDLGAVVVGFDKYAAHTDARQPPILTCCATLPRSEFNYYKFATATTLLRYNPDALFVSTNPCVGWLAWVLRARPHTPFAAIQRTRMGT